MLLNKFAQLEQGGGWSNGYLQSIKFQGDPPVASMLSDGSWNSLLLNRIEDKEDKSVPQENSRWKLLPKLLERLESILLEPDQSEFEMFLKILKKASNSRRRPLEIDISGIGLEKTFYSNLSKFQNINVIDKEKEEMEKDFDKTRINITESLDIDPFEGCDWEYVE
jgi:hypothetical protein